MGNQASSPQPSPQTTGLPPVCDRECQRQKQLAGLKTVFEQKTQTKDTDPEGYEQARLAYFTQLNGQGWLATEKERIAKDEIKPVISTYTTQYNNLKNEKKNKDLMANLISGLKYEQQNDQDELRFLDKEFTKDKQHTDVLNRLSVINQTSPISISNYSTFVVDAILVIIGLLALYMVYSKFSKIKMYFGYNSSVVSMGGKRVLH